VQFQCDDTALKIMTDYSDDVNFLRAFHLKFFESKSDRKLAFQLVLQLVIVQSMCPLQPVAVVQFKF